MNGIAWMVNPPAPRTDVGEIAKAHALSDEPRRFADKLPPPMAVTLGRLVAERRSMTLAEVQEHFGVSRGRAHELGWRAARHGLVRRVLGPVASNGKRLIVLEAV